jgi:hypothetical protein
VSDVLPVWGRILVHNGLVQADDWAAVESYIRKRVRPEQGVGAALVKAGVIDEEQRRFIEGLIARMQDRQRAVETHAQQVDLAPERPADAPRGARSIQAHPQSRRDRDYQPAEDQTLDLSEDKAVFDGQAARVQQHASAKRDRDYTPAADEVLDLEPETPDAPRRRIVYDDNPASRAGPAGTPLPSPSPEPEEGQDLEIVGLDEHDDVAGFRVSEVDWVEATSHDLDPGYDASGDAIDLDEPSDRA